MSILPSPKTHADWQIAQAAEEKMQSIYALADKLGVSRDELLPHGNFIAKMLKQLTQRRLARVNQQPQLV